MIERLHDMPAGTLGFRAAGEIESEDYEEVLVPELRRALEAGGSSLDDVIKVTIFLTDMGNFKEVIELRRQFFSEPYPADTIAEVKALYAPEVMIEIEAIAAVRDGAAT